MIYRKFNLWLIVTTVFGFILFSCSTKSNVENETSIIKEDFGKMPDGTVVDVFTMTNNNGIQVKAITYGGIITSLRIPDRDGKLDDIVLGYDNLDSYVKNNPYFGAIIGRFGNRISKGKFQLEETEYQLATNNIGNHLHGGIKGFDKVVWKGESVEVSDGVGIKFNYTSPDMEEGYPGTLKVEVTYSLLNDNSLRFEYSATTDKKTIVNLTNHSYYNLSGMKEDILSHELKINSSAFLPVDSTLIPTGIDSVKDTPFDFTQPKPIGRDINEENIQLKNGSGYDHCWVLDNAEGLHFAASLYEPKSGRYMEIFSMEPPWARTIRLTHIAAACALKLSTILMLPISQTFLVWC
jgi:aldose 1-epimerase